MSRIEVEHNGHTITYAENEDVWRCWEMDVEAKTLSAVKTKLNKLDADARRVNVPVIIMHHWSCRVDYYGQATLIEGGGVWVNEPQKGGGVRRRKMPMDSVILDTPENRAGVVAAEKRYNEAQAIEKEAKAMIAAIPRVTAIDLKALTNGAKE